MEELLWINGEIVVRKLASSYNTCSHSTMEQWHRQFMMLEEEEEEVVEDDERVKFLINDDSENDSDMLCFAPQTPRLMSESSTTNKKRKADDVHKNHQSYEWNEARSKMHCHGSRTSSEVCRLNKESKWKRF